MTAEQDAHGADAGWQTLPLDAPICGLRDALGADLATTELAERLGVKQPNASALLKHSAGIGLSTLARYAEHAGLVLEVRVRPR